MLVRRCVVGLLLLCTSCSPGRGTPPGRPARPTISSDTTVFDQPTTAVLQVESRHILEVTISVLTPDGVQHRLGRVSTARTVRFNIARYATLNGTLRFVAEPTGSRSNVSTRTVSPSVVVKLGSEARWTIERDVARSHLEVR